MIAKRLATGADGGRASLPFAASAPPAIDPAHLGASILIVEDEVMIAWSLESLFEEMGFADIGMVPDGPRALAAAQANRPDLVISDINLGSSLDGVDAATEIVAGTRTPVIFVTGYADATTRARILRQIPAAAILRKPVQPDELRRAVIAAFESRLSQ